MTNYQGKERRNGDPINALARRLDGLEKRFEKFDGTQSHIEAEVGAMRVTVREVKHEMANNTMETQSTARQVREMKLDMASTAESTQTILTVVQSLQMLDKISRLAVKGLSIVAPLAAAFAAMKAWVWK